MITDELRICGLVAVKARFERNPGSIARLYFDLASYLAALVTNHLYTGRFKRSV